MKIIKLAYLLFSILIIGVYLLPTGAAASVSDKYVFRVLLDGKPIGTHELDIQSKNQIQEVKINASLDVKWLFLSVYQYQHDNNETWHTGCLQSIQSTTNDNGDIYRLSGIRNEDELLLKTETDHYSLQGCIRSFAYWNPQLLQSDHLLNTQTGEYLSVNFKELGFESISLGERKIRSRRIQLVTAKDVIDLWYSDAGRWIALQSETRSGNILRYELMEYASDV